MNNGNDKKHSHYGHRQRVKDRFLKDGLDSFAPHDVMELLLYFAIAQGNVNDNAHNLINAFGSVSAVFDAPYEELLNVKGIGTHAATLIKLIPEISRRYFMDALDEKTKLDTPQKIGNYLTCAYIGLTVETVYVLCFNNNHELIIMKKIHEGSINSAMFHLRKITEAAILSNAVSIVIAHNHPSGQAIPSNDDINTTRRIIDSLTTNSIDLIEHFIIAKDRYIGVCSGISGVYEGNNA